VAKLKTLARPVIERSDSIVVCLTDTVVFWSANVPNATSYTWSITGPGRIFPGNVTTFTTTDATVRIKVSNVSSTSFIRLVATSCDNVTSAIAQSNIIAARPLPTAIKPFNLSQFLCPFDTVTFFTTANNFATTYVWILPATWSSVNGTNITTGPSIRVIVGPATNVARSVQVRMVNCLGSGGLSAPSTPQRIGHGTVTFTSGQGNVFPFPPCVDTLNVTMSAGGGGFAYALLSNGNIISPASSNSQRGALLQATLVFTSKPDTIFVNVGEKGGNGTDSAAGNAGIGGAGANGGDARGGKGSYYSSGIVSIAGGGGGGSTDLRIGDNSNRANRILIAGGGGGMGLQSGTTADTFKLVGRGGNGATGTTSYNGTNGTTSCSVAPGATTTGPGLIQNFTCPYGNTACRVIPSSGSGGIGGNGGRIGTSPTCFMGAGGGGGGGYFGGAGNFNGGGGGGSTYAPALNTPVNTAGATYRLIRVSFDGQSNAGNGQVTLTW
jgi:hypothetical protein